MLVVDDLEDNRELFAAVLRGEGFIVTTASDGVEALEIAARERPRVILMDLAMPRLDGYDTIERLRREDHGRAAHIIVVSAFIDPIGNVGAREIGADAVLGKPCRPRDLVALVNDAFAAFDVPTAAAG